MMEAMGFVILYMTDSTTQFITNMLAGAAALGLYGLLLP